MTRLFLLHADLGQGIPLGMLQVFARIVVDFVSAVLSNFSHRGLTRQQARTGCLKIVVGQRILAGTQLLLHLPSSYGVFSVKAASHKFIAGRWLADRKSTRLNSSHLG